MSNRFVISDTHFGHKGIVEFNIDNDDPTSPPLRPWDNIDEHDAALVANWNGVVNPKDTVYHLGDAVINRRMLAIFNELNGRKILVKGNHDIFKLKDYLPHFTDIRACVVHPKEGIIMSHIPISGECMHRFPVNVHGHLHGNLMPEPWYISACVEKINYTPMSYDVMFERARAINERWPVNDYGRTSFNSFSA